MQAGTTDRPQYFGLFVERNGESERMANWERQRDELKALGDEKFKKGDYEGACNNYTGAIAIDDANKVLYSNRSAAWLKQGERGRALKDAEKCVELDGGWAKGWSRLGAARFALGRLEGALEAYEAGLKIDADNTVLKEGRRLCGERIEREEEEKKRKEEEKKKEEEEEKAKDDDLLGDFFGEIDATTTEVVNEREVKPQDKYTNQDLGTGNSQIDRLLQTNYKWKNLNPFEVMMLDVDANPEDVKLRYKKLSSLVHPDKNLGNESRASEAFDFVKVAYGKVKDVDKKNHAIGLIEAGRERARTGAKLEGDALEEAQRKEVMKVFAELEMRRRDVEKKKRAGQKREREQEDAEADRLRAQGKFERSWRDDERVENRVGGWRGFIAKKKKTDEG